MGLEQQLRADMKEAMKAGDKVRLSTVRALISELHNAQLAEMGELDEAGEMDMLVRQAKRRRESIEAFTGGGRVEMAAQEAAELAVIETYLPQPLSAEEALAFVAETGCTHALPSPRWLTCFQRLPLVGCMASHAPSSRKPLKIRRWRDARSEHGNTL
jgi:uncharacterized protein YqeY